MTTTTQARQTLEVEQPGLSELWPLFREATRRRDHDAADAIAAQIAGAAVQSIADAAIQARLLVFDGAAAMLGTEARQAWNLMLGLERLAGLEHDRRLDPCNPTKVE